MSLYVGINNSPKNIVNLLIGKNGNTAEATTAYTGGVNSKDLIYNSFDLDKELTQVNPVEALISGKITKDDIGKTVYLSNSVSSCQEWQICGINHDNTAGTVDLFPKYILGSCKSTDVNSYITNVYNGFSFDIQSATKNMKYGTCNISYFSSSDAGSYPSKSLFSDMKYTTSKTKLPSFNELGVADKNSNVHYGIDNPFKVELSYGYEYTLYEYDGDLYELFAPSVELFTKHESTVRSLVNESADSYLCRGIINCMDGSVYSSANYKSTIIDSLGRSSTGNTGYYRVAFTTGGSDTYDWYDVNIVFIIRF